MKIAIEAQRIFRPNKHGMDFVALETIRCLQRLDTKNEYFIFTGEGEDRCLEESPNMHITTLRCPSYPLWEQWALPRAVARVKPDLLHCTSNTAPVWGNAPLILTLHDIIFLEQQAARNKSLYQSLGRVYRRLVVPRILPRCRMVITVSQFECDRIRTALNFDPGRIMAIHNGYNDRFRPMEGTAETVRKYLRDPEYLFFLGNTDPKKNTPGTLKAYAEYVRRSENPLPLLVVDLGERQPVKRIAACFMQGFYADIWMPRAVEISVSDDDRHYTPLAAVENDIPFEYKQDCYREFGWSGQTAARYVRLKARHNGHPGGWIFTDEIIVE